MLLLLVLISPVHAEERKKVVSTIGQIHDVVQQIGGDHFSTQGLMGPGVDPHLYKASQSDVRKLANADIIFYNGLHLEAKLTDVFEKMARSKTTVGVADLIDPSRLLDHEDYENSYDPHIWFDLSLWSEVVQTITETLIKEDDANKSVYLSKAKAYRQKLDELDAYARQQIALIPKEQRVLVTAHDAFRYFGRAYDFDVVGLQGISTASEAGAKDVRQLADLIVARKIKAIFIESSIPERNVKAVQDAVAAQGWTVRIGGELFSDAMGDEGTEEGTFIGMFKHNVDTIVNALK